MWSEYGQKVFVAVWSMWQKLNTNKGGLAFSWWFSGGTSYCGCQPRFISIWNLMTVLDVGQKSCVLALRGDLRSLQQKQTSQGWNSRQEVRISHFPCYSNQTHIFMLCHLLSCSLWNRAGGITLKGKKKWRMISHYQFKNPFRPISQTTLKPLSASQPHAV